MFLRSTEWNKLAIFSQAPGVLLLYIHILFKFKMKTCTTVSQTGKGHGINIAHKHFLVVEHDLNPTCNRGLTRVPSIATRTDYLL